MPNQEIHSQITGKFANLQPDLFYPWNVNAIDRKDGKLVVTGWALPLAGRLANTQIYCNGLPGRTEWTEYPEFESTFSYWPNGTQAGFTSVWELDGVGRDLLCLEVRTTAGEMLPPQHRMYFSFDIEADTIVPDDTVMSSIGNIPPILFVHSGYSLAHGFDRVIRLAGGSGLAGACEILDWGCGSARVTQHVRRFAQASAKVAAIDVDPRAIEWCRANVRGVDFGVCDLNPPTRFNDGRFDLVYAYSVLTHLRIDDARRWVSEIRRILKPGGYFAFTTLGVTSMAWLFPGGEPNLAEQIVTRGISDIAKNTDIDGVIADKDYYRNTWVSNRYVRDAWGGGFAYCYYESCFHHYQDVHVMRKL
jgi:SAM-dependent methyltransferase